MPPPPPLLNPATPPPAQLHELPLVRRRQAPALRLELPQLAQQLRPGHAQVRHLRAAVQLQVFGLSVIRFRMLGLRGFACIVNVIKFLQGFAWALLRPAGMLLVAPLRPPAHRPHSHPYPPSPPPVPGSGG
jgi:hypothetical protein